MSRQHQEWHWLGCLAMALIACTANALPAAAPVAAGVLVEAESFAEPGGWLVDAQFMDVMGSPYLLAHGLGKPVADARTPVVLPAAGTYRLWARTRDWTAPHPDSAGQFQIRIDGCARNTRPRHAGCIETISPSCDRSWVFRRGPRTSPTW